MNRSAIARLAAAFILYSLTAFARDPQAIQITRSGSQVPAKGSVGFFSGGVLGSK
ncbi:MAG TPA: hypothetical protein VIY49_19370 [Bryobacteraceae bacterium]